jgi:hypothetical protein
MYKKTLLLKYMATVNRIFSQVYIRIFNISHKKNSDYVPEWRLPIVFGNGNVFSVS